MQLLLPYYIPRKRGRIKMKSIGEEFDVDTNVQNQVPPHLKKYLGTINQICSKVNPEPRGSRAQFHGRCVKHLSQCLGRIEDFESCLVENLGEF